MKCQIQEYNVDTSVDCWVEVKITHPNINKEQMTRLIESISPTIDWCEKSYIASNGLIRLNIKNVTIIDGGTIDRYFTDLALHVNDGEVILQRNSRRNFMMYENDLLYRIIKTLESK